MGLEADRFQAGRFEGFDWGISAITLGELRLGLLRAADPDSASRRLSTYLLARRFEALPVDEPVSDAWTLLVSQLRAAAEGADKRQLGRRHGDRPWDPCRDAEHRLRCHARRRGHQDLRRPRTGTRFIGYVISGGNGVGTGRDYPRKRKCSDNALMRQGSVCRFAAAVRKARCGYRVRLGSEPFLQSRNAG